MNASRLRVLVVDDDALNRFILAKFIEKAGHEVIEATNGQEAIAAFEQGDGCDLMFMDLRMPELSGPETVKRIRLIEQDNGHSHTFIVIVSAVHPSSTEFAGMSECTEGFVEKPYFFERIQDFLDQAILLKAEGLRINRRP